MKKILLSCVTCLLALGLVTACNNEDEDVSGGGGDSTTQDSGSGGDTTQGGGSSEPITLENYVVSFSFFDEENNPTTLGDGYSLYLAGSWDNWAEDSWIECLYNETTGYYTGTFESIVTGTYEYKGVSCETGSPSWSGDEVVTNEYGGNASLTVTETNSGQVIEVTIVEPTYVYNYTLSITLTNENGEDPIPSYATAYIAGDWDKWTEFLPLTSEGNGVYSYTFTSITTGWHSFRGYMWYKGETVNWDNCVEIIHDTYEENGVTLPCDASFEVTDEIADGGKSELNFVVTETLDEEHTSGGSSEPVTLYNYTVSFSFVDETGNATTLGDGYTLYLQGSWALVGENWADEWIECSYDQATGYYTGTFTSIETGTYEYKGVSCLTTDGGSWSGEQVVTDNGENEHLTVTETNSGQVITVTLVPPVYLSNYTLSFTFSGETIPDYAALYITGDFNGWALDALTLCEDDPIDETALAESLDDQTENEVVYTYTVESISVGKHEYKVIACYANDEANWDDCVEVVTDNGDNATLEVLEEYGDSYTHAISYEIPSSIDFTTLQPETLSNVTLRFTFYATDGTKQLTIPEGYKISVAGDFTSTAWTVTTLTEDTSNSGLYCITLDSVVSGTYEFEFLYNKTTDTDDDLWKHPLASDNLFLKISKGTSGETIDYDVVTAYDDFNDIIHEINPDVKSDFYIVLLDASETPADSFASATIALGAGGSYFTGSPSVGTTTGGTTYLASPKGTAPTWTNDWFTFYDGSTNWDYKIECNYLEVPSTSEYTCAVYVAYAHLNILLKSNTLSSENPWDGYWTTDVADINAFIASL